MAPGLSELLFGNIFDPADGDHLHCLELMSRLIHLKVVLSGHLSGCWSLRHRGSCLGSVGFDCVVEDASRVLRDNLLELLDLRFQRKVGPLEILDVLVLGFHGDDLHVKAL